MPTDWYRKTSWSGADQDDFEKRLGRARASSRQQYLKIQAITLKNQGARFCPAAIALLDRSLALDATSIDVGPILTAKAECLLALGHRSQALDAYLDAVQALRARPNVETWAWLDFAWLVATAGVVDRSRVALDLLDEFFREAQLFPVITFRARGSRAFILASLGQHEAAAEEANAALAAAAQTKSGAAHHPFLGIVGPSFAPSVARLRAIANRRASFLARILDSVRRRGRED